MDAVPYGASIDANPTPNVPIDILYDEIPDGDADHEGAEPEAALRDTDIITLPFDELYKRFRDKLVNYCREDEKRPEDAQDIAQEVFIKLLEEPPEYRGDGQMMNLLKKKAHYIIRKLQNHEGLATDAELNSVFKDGVKTRQVKKPKKINSATLPESPAAPPASKYGTEEWIQRRIVNDYRRHESVSDQIDRAVEQLTDSERQIFQLALVERYTSKQIARQLRVSKCSIDKRRERLKEKLKGLLAWRRT